MCGQCPVNAKFTLLGDMPGMFQDARIDLHLRARAEQLETMNDRVGAVVWRENGALHSASADLVVLGANGIFNPHLLLKSGIADGPVGLGLQEQLPLYAIADLDGLEDGDGSAHATGIGYNFADGPWRKEAAGGFYELTNLPLVRPDPVKWRQTVRITFMLDDLRQERNRVIFDPDTPDTPVVRFEDYSEYAHSGRERIEGQLGRLLSHLPVEDIRLRQPAASGHAHLQGTAVMGRSPRTSVVDGGLLHHRLRNLVVAGSSAFPTAAGANPTLTIAALSLRAADRLY
jgi:choline dehydrogenase-like flavoprotein